MRIELKDFQQDAVNNIKTEIQITRYALERNNKPQTIIFSSPTGSGKTVMMAALIEDLLFATNHSNTESDTVFLWLSDQPELNKQSRDRILATSDKLRSSNLILVEADSFDQDTFTGGNVYFLNTQKLGEEKRLVTKGDNRAYSIWETIEKTTVERGDRFYVIIDEAHRGTRKSAREEERSKTILQKFILGSLSDQVQPIKMIIGMSATPQRFTTLLQQSGRSIHPVDVSPEAVRASGLIKDKVVLYYPEDDQPTNWSLLAEAAREWKTIRDKWEKYTQSQGIMSIHPILVVQVRDGDDAVLTETNLDKVVQTIEEVIGPLQDEELVHSFQENKSVEAGGHKIEKIEASRIQENINVKVVIFKMSLTTGWDCPRAEVMMSFRRAHDHTLIAQLVGRMIRTPLARRIEENEYLNSVALYLPYYDREGLNNVINHLRNDPEYVPPTTVEFGIDQIVLSRLNIEVNLLNQLQKLPTYHIEHVRQQTNIHRLLKMARLLTMFHTFNTDALKEAKLLILQTLEEERERLQTSDPEFEIKVSGKGQILIRPVTIDQGIWQSSEGKDKYIEASEINVNDLFQEAKQRLGIEEGIEIDYLKSRINLVTIRRAKIELFLLMQDQKTWERLEEVCGLHLDTLFTKYGEAITSLPSSKIVAYNRIQAMAKEPKPQFMSIPSEIHLTKQQISGSQVYKHHLYSSDNLDFTPDLKSWERQVLNEELKRHDLVTWLRNYDRKSWALAIPYKMGNKWERMFPDFIIIRRSDDQYHIDLLEPHSLYLADSIYKAKGLVEFSRKYKDKFDRIELICIYEERGLSKIRRLNLNNKENQDVVMTATGSADLDQIFMNMKN